MRSRLHHTPHEDAQSKENMQINDAHHKETQRERRRGFLIVIKTRKIKSVPEYDVRELNGMTANRVFKGALAQESHTSTQLVSPATGCQKKKKIHLWSRASEHKIE